MTEQEDTSYLATVTCKRHHLQDVWKSLRMMIKNKWTVGSDDDAFLMETMSDLARFDKDTPDDLKFTLPFSKMRACWLAVKYLLDKQMVPLDAQAPLLEILSLMGIELDRVVAGETSPEQLLTKREPYSPQRALPRVEPKQLENWAKKRELE